MQMSKLGKQDILKVFNFKSIVLSPNHVVSFLIYIKPERGPTNKPCAEVMDPVHQVAVNCQVFTLHVIEEATLVYVYILCSRRGSSVCSTTLKKRLHYYYCIKMFAARGVLRLAQRLAGVSVSRRGCAGAIPVDDIVNGLTDEQIQVN